MNKDLNYIQEYRTIAKELNLEPMFTKEELKNERNIRNSMRLITGK